MWYEVENGNAIRPSDIDTTSSSKFVYFRKNITLIEETYEYNDVFPAHYHWEELKIPRDIWDVCQKVFNHDSALDDVYEALTELAGIIVGE